MGFVFLIYLLYMNEIRKIIKETLEESFKQKRYVASIDFYIYAENESDAINQAKNIASEIDLKYDNKASLNSIGEKPFGLSNYKSIDFSVE